MAERTARTSGRTRPTSADTTSAAGERGRSGRTSKGRPRDGAATRSSSGGTTSGSRSPSSRDRSGANGATSATSSSNGRRRSSGAALARRIRDDLGDVLGVPTERVIGMRRDGDTWQATVEVLELRRIPETMDLLAVYQVTADRRGEIESWERLGRYARSDSQGE